MDEGTRHITDSDMGENKLFLVKHFRCWGIYFAAVNVNLSY